MNLLCWISLLSAVKAWEARHFKIDKTTESDIEQFDSERPNIDLEKGSNMGDHSSAKSLQSEVASKIGRQYVGVAVNIQNYSPFLLTDVQKSIKYGYSVFFNLSIMVKIMKTSLNFWDLRTTNLTCTTNHLRWTSGMFHLIKWNPFD